MSFLRELNRSRMDEEASGELEALPHDVKNELENHIRNAAKDMDKKVENALELVKEAYKVENVQLPTPAMKKAWSQFSELLQYATEKLHKYRGIDGDWRMSTYMFREHVESQKKFAVTINTGSGVNQSTISADDKDSLVEYLTDELTDGELTPVITEEGNQVRIGFKRMNVRQKLFVTLTEI